jgi:hypothetical protein
MASPMNGPTELALGVSTRAGPVLVLETGEAAGSARPLPWMCPPASMNTPTAVTATASTAMTADTDRFTCEPFLLALRAEVERVAFRTKP